MVTICDKSFSIPSNQSTPGPNEPPGGKADVVAIVPRLIPRFTIELAANDCNEFNVKHQFPVAFFETESTHINGL